MKHIKMEIMNLKKLGFPVLFVISSFVGKAQDTLYVKDSAVYSTTSAATTTTTTVTGYAANSGEKRPTPYTIYWKRDIPINIALIGVNLLGVKLVNDKKDLTMAELATRTRDKVPFFDRGNVGYFDESIDKASYIPFYVSFAWPAVMMVADGDQTRHIGQVLDMYLQTMAVTGAMFTLTDGLVNRSRPLVYGADVPLDRRLSNNSQRSFYAGHTAATAASSFFTAKVFSDMNPDSKLKPFIWGAAAALPAVVGYMRYKSGQHFLSDNVVGYVLGAATGILIPQWHKTKKSDKMTILPTFAPNNQGVAILYKL
jgi:membrane-associated phospholipid phosphatase